MTVGGLKDPHASNTILSPPAAISIYNSEKGFT
jgi:hypothetical protein